MNIYITAKQNNSIVILHGPSIFAVKAEIYGVLYNQSSSVAFDETSSYWSGPFNWSAFRNHQGSTFTEKDRNKLNYRIGPRRTYQAVRTVLFISTELQNTFDYNSCDNATTSKFAVHSTKLQMSSSCH